MENMDRKARSWIWAGQSGSKTSIPERLMLIIRTRLQRIRKQVAGRVRLVLHGTNGFPDELIRQCIAAGISKVNVNKLVLADYNRHLQICAATLPQTQLIEEGTVQVAKMQEHQMKVCLCAGKA